MIDVLLPLIAVSGLIALAALVFAFSSCTNPSRDEKKAGAECVPTYPPQPVFTPPSGDDPREDEVRREMEMVSRGRAGSNALPVGVALLRGCTSSSQTGQMHNVGQEPPRELWLPQAGSNGDRRTAQHARLSPETKSSRRLNGNEIAMEYEKDLFVLKLAIVVCFAIAALAMAAYVFW